MKTNAFKIKSERKSDKRSEEFRLIGNNEFAKKHWFNALAFYNRAIAYSNSKNVISLCYANRSAVYFETKMYDHCLENIQLARKNCYPADKMAKLNEREAKCMKQMQVPKDENAEDYWDFFKLSYPAHEKIPWLADCVEMRHTQKYGRGIYAKRDLKAGDIISIEEPIFNFVREDWGYYQCFNCFKANAMNLFPSEYTSSIMFCSDDCKRKIQSTAVDKNDMVSMDMKLLSEVAAHFGGYKQFDEYMNRTNLMTLNKSIFDYDFSNPEDPEYEGNRINCLLSLCTNSIPAENCSDIKKYVSKKTAHHLASLLMLNQKFSSLFDGSGEKEENGYFISLFSSLINHSCIGNVQCFVVDGKAVTLVEKPIKAGEQLFDSYTGCGSIADASVKKNLEEKHMFKCDCKGCTKNVASSLYEMEGGIFDMIRCQPPMYQHNYEYIKECLEDARYEINEYPEENLVLSSNLICAFMMMEALAFHLAYPFHSV